jgi:hypothetical protein
LSCPDRTLSAKIPRLILIPGSNPSCQARFGSESRPRALVVRAESAMIARLSPESHLQGFADSTNAVTLLPEGTTSRPAPAARPV